MNTPRRPSITRFCFLAGIVGCITLATLYWSRQRPHQPTSPSAAVQADIEQPSGSQSLAAAGLPAEAKITDPRAAQLRFANGQHQMAPNPRGDYPRVTVPASTVISALVPFPDSTPGETVRVQTEDGGTLRGSAAAGIVTVDSDRQVSLDFQTSDFDGIHRVTLHRGSERRVLEFWVGPEAPVLVRR